MPKRKRGTDEAGDLAQDRSACPPLRRSARLLERESLQLSPIQEGKRQRRESEQCRALPSSSTTGSTSEDCHPTQPSENHIERSTNDTGFESHLGKTHSAPVGLGVGKKRKFEEEPSRTGREPRKRPWKSKLDGSSPNLDSKEQSELPGDGLSEKRKVQSEEAVPETRVPVVESLEKPAQELGAQEIEQKENPISYWAAHRTWPENFAEHSPMAPSNSVNKRPRTSDCSQDGKNERSRSYSQSRKEREVPEQYTAAYQVHIRAKGLDMDRRKGEDFVSEESKKTCAELSRIHVDVIGPTAVPQDKIRDAVEDCQNRNEAIVNRNVTPLIIPSLRLLYYCGADDLEHVADEVNADWYKYCVLEGPQIRPDLAIGLFSSAFTESEIDKLQRYTSVDNWTKVTPEMYFPFLMCEVKCGREGLDMADRQNMHSCSVAVRALLRIEQEADKYRPEKKTESLNGQVLVFSISHDQQDARLYGHYAQVHGEKWTYYRYQVQKFNLTKKEGLLAIHNAVRNILNSHLPGHVRRLQDALAALPDPTGLSFAASEISLSADNSQQDSQDRDANSFVVPPRPDSSQNGGGKKKGQESRLVERIDKLMQQLEVERKESRKREEEHKEENRRREEENRRREERQRQEHKEEIERQRKESEEREEENTKREERQRKESEEEREENRKREQEHKMEMEKLLQLLLEKPAN